MISDLKLSIKLITLHFKFVSIDIFRPKVPPQWVPHFNLLSWILNLFKTHSDGHLEANNNIYVSVKVENNEGNQFSL